MTYTLPLKSLKKYFLLFILSGISYFILIGCATTSMRKPDSGIITPDNNLKKGENIENEDNSYDIIDEERQKLKCIFCKKEFNSKKLQTKHEDKCRRNSTFRSSKSKIRKRYTKESTLIICNHGLDSNKSVWDNFKKDLSRLGKVVTPCRKEKNCNHLSILEQSKVVSGVLLEEVKDTNIKNVTVVGHSIGGLVSLFGVEKALKSNKLLRKKILNGSIKLKFELMQTPFQGSFMAKEMPDEFLEVAGVGKKLASMLELKDIDNLTKLTDECLRYMHKTFKGKIEFNIITGTCSFLSCMGTAITLANIPGLKGKLKDKYGIDDPKDMKKFLKSTVSDGIVTLGSQTGRNTCLRRIIKRAAVFNDLGHTDFLPTLPSFIQAGFRASGYVGKPSLNDSRVLKELKAVIKS